MAVRIRLSRCGTTNAPFYHIVAADSRAPRDGKFLEGLGFYNPRLAKEKETEQNKRFSVNLERFKYWMSVGATLSETTAKLMLKAGFSECAKFIKPVVKGEFHGISRKEKNKVLAERAEKVKKAAAEKKKAMEAAKKAVAAGA